jgi:Phosphate-induced protein 1 conserved region
MTKFTKLVAFSMMLLLTTFVLAQEVRPGSVGHDLAPNGKHGSDETGNASNVRGFATTTIRGSGINYHGGPVILGTTHVYYIWYGTWSGTAQNILTTYAQNVGGSRYFNINTTYWQGTSTNQQHVSNAVTFGGSTTDNYSLGKSLTDANLATIVGNAISSGRLPKDTNAVYFVLTASDVNETSGFCTQYCGFHTHGTISGSDIKYAFVGNAARCLSACAAQTTSPNGDAGADASASIVAHELEEAVSDPALNAWFDSRGQENADKCAWTFGTTSRAANGSAFNLTLGGMNFLIQRNWVNSGAGSCSMSF